MSEDRDTKKATDPRIDGLQVQIYALQKEVQRLRNAIKVLVADEQDFRPRILSASEVLREEVSRY